jgi:hypothetical protein
MAIRPYSQAFADYKFLIHPQLQQRPEDNSQTMKIFLIF